MSTLWNLLDDLKSPKYKWVDLTHELSGDTPRWYGFGPMETDVLCEIGADCPFHFDSYSFPAGQYGTHANAPVQFHPGARSLDQIGLTEMVLPLVVIDKSAACAENLDYELTIEDLKEWESKYGWIPAHSFVAFRSDWHKRPDMNNYDDDDVPHYPGWKLSAIQWLVEERNIAAIGHETGDTDAPAFNKGRFMGESYILGQNRLQCEFLTNLDQVPPTGSIIFVTFPKVKNGTGFMSRIFAICPNT